MGTIPETLPISQGTSTRLTGYRRWIGRGVWAVLVLAILIVEIKSLSGFFPARLQPCDAFCPPGFLWPEEVEALGNIGLSMQFHAWFFFLIDVLPTLLTLVAVALLLGWKRPDDWLALYTSLFLMALPIIKLPFIPQPVWSILYIGAGILVLTGAPLLMYIFPDGRFVPRWTRWVVLPMVAWMTYFVLIPDSVAPAGVDVVLLTTFALLASGVGALLYRYLRISGPAEKRQIKWAVLAFTLRPISEVGIRQVLIPMLFPIAVTPGLGRVLFHMAAIPIFSTVPFIVTGVALGIAIFRYRLWDVDFIINRSLVYSALTAILGAIFAGAFVGLRWVLELALGGEQAVLAAVIASSVVVGLFPPVRNRLRRYIDERFYGIKVDYVAAVKAYGKARQEAAKPQMVQTSFGPYSDLVLLGRGGMGEVYRAYHPILNRAVAIKLLPPHMMENDIAQKRFLREAQTVARLKHPNIVTLHDVGEQNERAYMVMEYIDGPDLSTVVKQRGRLPYDEALPLLQDIATALDYAHSQGIIHRDVKPSNVMIEHVTGSGQRRNSRAVLMDFGIARSAAEGMNLTQSGMIGTMDYISPEQIQGSSELDGRADVYSLSVMAYQVLTGELPFRHNNLGAMVIAHLMQPPPDPRHIVPDLPAEAAEGIMRGMAKTPEARFATAGELVAAMTVNRPIGSGVRVVT